MRRRFLIALATTMILATVALPAHDDFRIVGIVEAYKANVLQVKKKDGKTVSVRVDKQTLITRDKKKVAPGELAAGLTVVVDAYGDTEDDSLALEIRIVPPIAAR